ncbi:hypothetical protein D9M71_236540 [compost metagenome]
MVEIGAEMPVADAVGQVAVGRGDDPHVDVARLVLAQALDLAVLQGTQQLGLQAQRQLADLVEEQRAAVCRLEASATVGGGAGESALDVAEQLALGQRLRQGSAVDLHQRLVVAPRVAVQAAGEQLLADSGLAEQQHRQLGVGDHVQLAEQLADDLAVTEDVAVLLGQAEALHIAARLAQATVLLLQAGHPHRRLDQQGEALQLTPRRLVEGTGVHGV